MASPVYKTQAIVLKKTKLGEKDLIVTMLAESGELLKCVAKGARKPGGSLAAKIELFGTVDALCAKGRSLDVLSEVKLIASGSIGSADLERTICAAPIAELLSYVALPDLPQPRLFMMARSAFEHLRKASVQAAPGIAAAALWKIMAQTGFRPSFERCVICDAELELSDKGEAHLFSPLEGGVICGECPGGGDAVTIDDRSLGWCSYSLAATFDELADVPMPTTSAFAVLALVRAWIGVHVGKNLRSFDFLFTSGIFE